MESVKSYIYAIFIVSITAGIVNILSSGNGKDNASHKNVKFICSLAVTATLLYPLKSVFSDFDFSFSLPDAVTDSAADTNPAAMTIIDMTEEKICRELESAVREKFGEEDVRVSLELDKSDLYNVMVGHVYLSAGSQGEEAAEYLESISGLKVELLPEVSHG